MLGKISNQKKPGNKKLANSIFSPEPIYFLRFWKKNPKFLFQKRHEVDLSPEMDPRPKAKSTQAAI